MNNPIPQLPSTSTEREFCYTCWRAQILCLCKFVEVVANKKEIIFLQHPNERTMPFNTARLAHLSLAKSQLISGIYFNDNEIISALAAKQNRIGLLFPSAEAQDLSKAPEQLESLIIVDGTWREAKKIIYHSSALQSIPHYSFSPEKPSNYRIRKEPSDSHISTIEATVYALGILEKNPGKFDPLIALFDRMVDRQIYFMQMNHLKTYAAKNRRDTKNLKYLHQVLFELSPEQRHREFEKLSDEQRSGMKKLARDLFSVDEI